MTNHEVTNKLNGKLIEDSDLLPPSGKKLPADLKNAEADESDIVQIWRFD